MTKLRYFDAPEYQAQKAIEEEARRGAKLTARGATQWLMGETKERSADEIAAHNARLTFEARKRYLATPEVRKATLEKMDRVGETTHAQFNRELPHGYSLVPTIESKLLEQYPHLCVTQFTHVPLKTKEKDVSCAIYVTNFDAAIDMAGEQPKFIVQSPDYGRMFFCIAWRIDAETGKATVAKDLFNNGLLFRTSDMQVAFDNTVHLTTGTKAAVWRERLKQSLKKIA